MIALPLLVVSAFVLIRRRVLIQREGRRPLQRVPEVPYCPTHPAVGGFCRIFDSMQLRAEGRSDPGVRCTVWGPTLPVISADVPAMIIQDRRYGCACPGARRMR